MKPAAPFLIDPSRRAPILVSNERRRGDGGQAVFVSGGVGPAEAEDRRTRWSARIATTDIAVYVAFGRRCQRGGQMADRGRLTLPPGSCHRLVESVQTALPMISAALRNRRSSGAQGPSAVIRRVLRQSKCPARGRPPTSPTPVAGKSGRGARSPAGHCAVRTTRCAAQPRLAQARAASRSSPRVLPRLPCTRQGTRNCR